MRALTHIAFLALAALPFASVAAAQDIPRVEVAGSYQFLQPVCPGVSCYNYPDGWQASVSTRITGWLSVVGEAGESLRTISMSSFAPIPLTSTTSGTLTSQSDTRLRIYDVLVGPRATMQVAHTRVFGELLFGMAHSTFADSFSINIPQEGANAGQSFSTAATTSVWQPRVGLDIPFTLRWATRFGVGYRMGGVLPTSISHGEVLFETGVVFRVQR